MMIQTVCRNYRALPRGASLQTQKSMKTLKQQNIKISHNLPSQTYFLKQLTTQIHFLNYYILFIKKAVMASLL